MIAARTTEFRRSRPKKGRRPADFIAALVVFIIVVLVAAPQAQQPQGFNPTKLLGLISVLAAMAILLNEIVRRAEVQFARWRMD